MNSQESASTRRRILGATAAGAIAATQEASAGETTAAIEKLHAGRNG